MPYKIILILFITSLLSASPLQAQDIRYRVEVLVLTHLRSVERASEENEIRDYSNALDFLTPVEEPEEVTEAAESTPVSGQPEGTGTEIAETEEPEQDPNEVVHHEEMSDVMREAWRRLRLSAPFRPQQYLSWEQGNQEPFPVLRIHDLDVVMVKDPHARDRLKTIEADLLESESERLEALQQADSEGNQAMQSAGVQPPAPPEQPEEPGLPDLAQYYRLDGTVTLRRSRFLHLDLDLQLREGIWEPEPLEMVSQDPVIFERAGPTSFLVHELQQSRQVKSARMEYFDGPKLSVLAFITAIQVESEEAP
jgi:hypothetical protein